MEKWDVVVAFSALAALFGSIVAPIVKLTRAITRLNATLESVEKNVADLTSENRADHARIREQVREQDRMLNDHETRIRVMEEG